MSVSSATAAAVADGAVRMHRRRPRSWIGVDGADRLFDRSGHPERHGELRPRTCGHGRGSRGFGAVAADQQPCRVRQQPVHLVQGDLEDVDVIGRGRHAGVARPQQHRQRLPHPSPRSRNAANGWNPNPPLNVPAACSLSEWDVTASRRRRSHGSAPNGCARAAATTGGTAPAAHAAARTCFRATSNRAVATSSTGDRGDRPPRRRVRRRSGNTADWPRAPPPPRSRHRRRPTSPPRPTAPCPAGARRRPSSAPTAASNAFGTPSRPASSRAATVPARLVDPTPSGVTSNPPRPLLRCTARCPRSRTATLDKPHPPRSRGPCVRTHTVATSDS